MSRKIEQIKTIQTRDSYYPIYKILGDAELSDGYYFYDEEVTYYIDKGISKEHPDNAYYGPYKDLDDVCKAAHRHYVAMDSL